jgi:hypothetical protein
MTSILELPRPHGFLVWRGKQTAIATDKPLETDAPILIISDGEAFGEAILNQPAQLKAKAFDSQEWFDQHCIYVEERKRYWPEADKFYVHKIASFEPYELPETFIDGKIVTYQPDTKERALIEKARRLPKTVILNDNALALSDGKFIAISDLIKTDELKTILKATYDSEPEFINEPNLEELPLYQLALVRNPRLRVVKKKLSDEKQEGDDMPFPNEHAARQMSPEGYKRIRRQNDKLGSGVQEDDTTELQSIRFDSNKFTPAEARAWLKEHDMNTSLEEATGEEKDKKMWDEGMEYSIPFGVITFSDLTAMQQATESAHEVDELTGQLHGLINNIMLNPEVADKQEALRNLVFEFGTLVNETMTATKNKKWQPLTDLAKRAVNAVFGKEEQLEEEIGIAIKTIKGDLWHFTWSTNAFQDRDEEIFSTKALENYVGENAKNGDKGTFDFWHIPGTEFAKKEWQAIIGRFLVEAGPYLDNEAGKRAKKFFRQHPNGHPAIAPEGWGASPEFRFLPEDREDAIFDHIWITKTSTLPRYAAANIWTEGKQIMLSDEQRKAAIEIFGEGFVKQIEVDGEKRTAELEAAGVAHKAQAQQQEAPKPVQAIKPEVTPKSVEVIKPKVVEEVKPEMVVDLEKLAAFVGKQFAVDNQPFAEALMTLGVEIKALTDRLEKLEKAETLKSKVETPRFTFSMLQRATEAVETQVKEGDGLKENMIGSTLLREGESVASRLFNKK